MKRLALAVALLAAACSSGGSDAPKGADPLCRFASPPLTSAAQARQMAADLKVALGPGNPVKVQNLAVSKAALALELAAGVVAPTSVDGSGADAGLVAANQAQVNLATACA